MTGQRIHLSPPAVDGLEAEYVLDALRSGWVAPLGPHVDAFEAEVADRVGASHAVALSSGTAGLHLALLAVGVAPGDEVVVPTLTFAASAFAVTYVGAIPVFVDSEPRSLNLDPTLLGRLLADRAAAGRLPAAVIVVDIFGQTADYDALLAVCAEFDVAVVEDAAEALGASHALGAAGALGRTGIFSFNGNKILTTSGGGMLVTDDASVAEQVRRLSTQARDPVAWYEHSEIGHNYRLSNVLAAIGRAQLTKLDTFVQRRRAIREVYAGHLEPAGVPVLHDAPWGRSNGWLTLARVGRAHVADVLAGLAAAGVEARHTWKPMHRQPVFDGLPVVLSGVADDVFADWICLPSGVALTDDDVARVARLVLELRGSQR